MADTYSQMTCMLVYYGYRTVKAFFRNQAHAKYHSLRSTNTGRAQMHQTCSTGSLGQHRTETPYVQVNNLLIFPVPREIYTKIPNSQLYKLQNTRNRSIQYNKACKTIKSTIITQLNKTIRVNKKIINFRSIYSHVGTESLRWRLKSGFQTGVRGPKGVRDGFPWGPREDSEK